MADDRPSSILHGISRKFGSKNPPTQQKKIPSKNSFGKRFLDLKPHPATPEENNEILSFTGEILTVMGGPLGFNNVSAYDKAALLDDFTLLINENNKPQADRYFSSLSDKIGRHFKGKHIRRILYVKLNVLKDVYDTSSNTLLSAGDVDEQQAVFRQHWMNLVKHAASVGASDIHIQTINNITNIELRVNSSLREFRQENANWGRQLIQCLFNMTDSSEATYKATNFQSGRISNKKFLPRNVQSVRMQFNPSADPASPAGGVYTIARLLYAGNRVQGDLDTLGYTAIQMRQLSIMRSKPFGINIIAGVTGSGKSTTLVKMLTGLKKEKPGSNIITVEDPPEYPIAGTKQLPVVAESNSMEARSGAFTTAISAVMRSDPDIIMIGEIRDVASAKLAFEACETGHQVYASLHASTATSILSRLEAIGVENYKLADANNITGLIGQRLIPKLCPHCRIKWTEARESGLLAEHGYKKDMRESVEQVAGEFIDNVYIKNPQGCRGGGPHPKPCDKGIAGRQVVAEIITPDMKFMDFITRHEVMNAQQYWLDNLDGLTMREHSFQQVVRGEVAPMDAQIVGGRFDEFDMKRRDLVFGKYMKTAQEWLKENE